MQKIFMVEKYPDQIIYVTRSPSKALAKACEDITYVIREYQLDKDNALVDSYFCRDYFRDKYC